MRWLFGTAGRPRVARWAMSTSAYGGEPGDGKFRFDAVAWRLPLRSKLRDGRSVEVRLALGLASESWMLRKGQI